MTRDTSRLRAVSLAALVVLSAVAGSVAFAGSAGAVSGVSPTSGGSLPNQAEEQTTQSYNFNYSYTGVNTTDDTTLIFSVPGEFDIGTHTVEMQNASGSVLNTTTEVGDQLRVTANSSTTTVYLSGSVELTTPAVSSETEYTIKVNATDNDGTTASYDDTLTVTNSDLTISPASGESFDPTEVDQETENRHTFNYSITGVDPGDTTDYSLTIPSDFSIEGYDIAVENASGEVLTDSVGESGDTLSLSTTSDTSTTYLNGSVNLTSPAVPGGQEQETYTDGVTISASDDSGSETRSESVSEDLTVQ